MKLRPPAKRIASFYLSAETCAALDVASGLSGLARGVLLDAAVTHKVRCRCEACLALPKPA